MAAVERDYAPFTLAVGSYSPIDHHDLKAFTSSHHHHSVHPSHHPGHHHPGLVPSSHHTHYHAAMAVAAQQLQANSSSSQ